MVQGLPVLSQTLGRKVREGLDVGQFLTRWFARPCVREIVPTSFFICSLVVTLISQFLGRVSLVSSYGLAAYRADCSGVSYLGAFLGLELGFQAARSALPDQK